MLQCADDDHPAGTTEEAGLPEISGQATFLNTVQATTEGQTKYPDKGVFYWAQYEYGGSVEATSPGPSKRDLMFRASRSNPIYGASDTVQMKSIYANIWQRVS